MRFSVSDLTSEGPGVPASDSGVGTRVDKLYCIKVGPPPRFSTAICLKQIRLQCKDATQRHYRTVR